MLVDIRILVDRIPGPDEEARIVEESRGVGGSAANVAIAASRLGGKSSIIAKIGLDDFGRIAVDGLLREGVDVSGLAVDLTRRTGFSIIARNPAGEITIYSYKGAAEALEPEDVHKGVIGKAKIVHIASLRPDTTREALVIAKKSEAKVSWDPGRLLARQGMDRLRDIISMVDIVFVNKNEAKSLTRRSEYIDAAEDIRNTGPGIVVIKLGEKGSYISTNKESFQVPAIKPTRVLDTTGAGDVYAAAFLVGLLNGYSVREAALYASAASSIKVERLGSHDAPSHEEIISRLEKSKPNMPE